MSSRARKATATAVVAIIDVAPVAKPARAARAAKKKAIVESESEEEIDQQQTESEEEEDVPIAPKKKATAAAPAVNAASIATKPVNSLHAQLATIFSDTQHSFHTHANLAVQAQKLLESNPNMFLTSFSALCAYLCSKVKKDANTQRVIEWAGQFVAKAFHSGAHAASGPFAEAFLEQLLDWTEAKDKTMRWRATQLFAELMKNMDEECDLPEWLFDGAVAALLVRAEDKIESVRVAAAAALHRFQTGEERDPVAAMYVRMMSLDQSALVRKAALEHVAAASSPKAINALLARTQDIVPAVRAAAFKAIQAKLHMKQLSLEYRARLIRLGFKDRDADVVKAAKALMDAWLATKDRDVIRLMRSMAVDTFSEECALLLAHLVKSGAHTWNTTVQPPYASAALTPERALYWRVLAETLHTMDDEVSQAALDAALPDTVELCRLLQAHQKDAFITAQLLALTGLADMADEAGRRELGSQIEQLLRDSATSQSLVGPLMKVYRLVHQDENDFIRVVLELLSDIHNPLDADEHPDLSAKREELEEAYNNLQASIEKLKVQKQAAINQENFAAAEQIKSQLTLLTTQLEQVEKELNSSGFQDESTWARLLCIVCDLLENTTRFKLNHPGLAGLRESLIQPGIQHDHLLIQSLGLKALSLYALLDRDTAKASLPMFLYAANYAETLAQQATAMRAVTDILMLFEDLLSTEQPEEQQSAENGDAPVAPATTLTDVQTLFNRHLTVAYEGGHSSAIGGSSEDQEVTEVCVMAIECLAKLLLFGRIPCTPPLLSAMLYIFFHPSTDTRITQCLAVFLPGFLLAREEHLETFFHSILPTIRILSSAVQSANEDMDDDPALLASSVWKGFSLTSAGRAMLSFISGPLNKRLVQGRPVIQAFAMELCAHLQAAASTSSASTLVSFVASMDLGLDLTFKSDATPFLPTFNRALHSIHLKDKQAAKDLIKFLEKLAKTHGEIPELDDAEGEKADTWLQSRVFEIKQEQQAELQASGAMDASEVESVSSKSSSNAAVTKKKPASKPGKKALRPKLQPRVERF